MPNEKRMREKERKGKKSGIHHQTYRIAEVVVIVMVVHYVYNGAQN